MVDVAYRQAEASFVDMLWILWFIIGAMAGSFLNVCIYRLPREQSIVQPRSHCPKCQHPIAWYDNIPLLSYLMVGGKCRHCRGAIHGRYPVVEALSGALSVAVVHQFGVGPKSLVYLVFLWALLVASFIDLEHQIIPDEISFGGLVAGLVLSGLIPQLHGTDQALVALKRSVIGAAVGGGLLYVTGTIGTLVFRKEAMGGGDVKLLAMAGSVLGWKLVTFTFFVAPVLALIPGVVVLLLKRSHVIPYGPFLSLALVLALFSGSTLIQMSGVEDTVQVLWMYFGWGS